MHGSLQLCSPFWLSCLSGGIFLKKGSILLLPGIPLLLNQIKDRAFLMSIQIHYTLCPVCGSAGISKVFRVKDNTASQEYFDIYHCSNCQARFTQNPPSETSIGEYYRSENYISHTDTSKGLVNRLYRAVRNFSINQKKMLIEKITGLTKGALLDVGSGTGYFAKAMQAGGWQVTGLEPDEGARTIAMQQHAINLFPADDLFRLPEKKYDAITLCHVLEQVYDLKNISQHLKEFWQIMESYLL